MLRNIVLTLMVLVFVSAITVAQATDTPPPVDPAKVEVVIDTNSITTPGISSTEFSSEVPYSNQPAPALQDDVIKTVVEDHVSKAGKAQNN